MTSDVTTTIIPCTWNSNPSSGEGWYGIMPKRKGASGKGEKSEGSGLPVRTVAPSKQSSHSFSQNSVISQTESKLLGWGGSTQKDSKNQAPMFSLSHLSETWERSLTTPALEERCKANTGERPGEQCQDLLSAPAASVSLRLMFKEH